MLLPRMLLLRLFKRYVGVLVVSLFFVWGTAVMWLILFVRTPPPDVVDFSEATQRQQRYDGDDMFANRPIMMRTRNDFVAAKDPNAVADVDDKLNDVDDYKADWKLAAEKKKKGKNALDKDIIMPAPPLEEVVRSSAAVPEIDLDKIGLIRNPEEQKLHDLGYNFYAFNGLISDRIGGRRNVPDTRHSLCKSQTYAHPLPTSSIIICYYNESPSALVRMVNSILDRTPPELIEEIFLIDDFSDLDASLRGIKAVAYENGWLSENSKIKMVKTERREGLIRAKVFGARRAVGQVLVFLDSHCEVNQQWLEPLVDRIKQNRKNVVCPIIDIIDSDSFRYVAAPMCYGGFNWGLFFKWDYPSAQYLQDQLNHIRPLKCKRRKFAVHRSPTMAGGLFAIDREYFKELGEYDMGMETWGAENVESSFRIWMCGGRLDIMPCSRVGHVFRSRRPYGSAPSFAGDSMALNSVRTARVWLDEFVEKVFENRPALRNTGYGDISERLELRRRLDCKSFRWYLENVYPQLLGETKSGKDEDRMSERRQQGAFESNILRRGKIYTMMGSTRLCLSSRQSRGSQPVLASCSTPPQNSLVWYYTDLEELKLGKDSRLCLNAKKGPRMSKCDEQKAGQMWKMNIPNKFQLMNPVTGLCLSVSQAAEGVYSDSEIIMTFCNKTNEIWQLF